MARAPKLNDLQLILLTTASQREDGSLLPPPERLAEQAARIHKAIPPLLKGKLVEEVDVTGVTRAWREEGERRIGVTITAAGRAIIGSAEEDVAPAESTALIAPAAPDPLANDTAAQVPATKIANVLDLLRRSDGATLSELVAATGWLPHTTRAALTGLRKKGHLIDKATRGEATTYIVKAAA